MFTNKTLKRKGKYVAKLSVFAILIGSMLVLPIFSNHKDNRVLAVDNLIKGGSFESDLDKYWVNWKQDGNERSYDLHRSYEVSSFENGSYSGAVTVEGELQEENNLAALISDNETNSFRVEEGQTYYLNFSAKASEEMELFIFLQAVVEDDYTSITEFEFPQVGTEWNEYLLEFTPEVTDDEAILFIGYDNMPEEATLNIDGIRLFEKNIYVDTDRVRGNIGDDVTVTLRNFGFFRQDQVEIELPYYDRDSGETTTTTVEPKEMRRGYMPIFEMKEGTFPGVGRVYVAGSFVGEFDYQVQPQVKEISPVLVRGGSDLTVYGDGFVPVEGQTKLILDVINSDGQNEKRELDYSFIDSRLTSITAEIPANVVRGRLQVATFFENTEGETVKQDSGTFSYNLRPRIYSSEWSQRGYDQVGDKIRIYGTGIAGTPRVHFYQFDEEDEEENGQELINDYQYDRDDLVSRNRAEVIHIGEDEVVIEVETPHNVNELSIVVEAGRNFSNKAKALEHRAKPRLEEIDASRSRQISSDSPNIPASKIGQEITLQGQGFSSASGTIEAEFQGFDERISVPVSDENLNRRGNAMTIEVPEGAQSGYVDVIVRGERSNSRPLEIIPTILDVSPENIEAGEEVVIEANGMGDRIELTKVNFHLGGDEKVSKTPEEIQREGDNVIIYVEAPAGLSGSDSHIDIQYDRWSSGEEFNLDVEPYISRAAINMDNKVLTIVGHGFSLNPRENDITYRYADENRTEIDPDVRKLGVYPTPEGQEIRIQIQDDYHFGYVTVETGGKTSNEVNFGPVKVNRVSRTIEHVRSEDRDMGVLYISGYNFGEDGGVRVGENWADIHYQSEFFIIAVIEKEYVYDNPVIVAKRQ